MAGTLPGTAVAFSVHDFLEPRPADMIWPPGMPTGIGIDVDPPGCDSKKEVGQ
jgi:hypothetical protein